MPDNDPAMFYRNQLNYMQSLQVEDPKLNPEHIEQLRKNIDFLGGIEDTVGSKDQFTHLI